MTRPSQGFRSRGRIIFIPTVKHLGSGDVYVVWSDIQDCFPGVVRVLHDDVYVPLLRNNSLYRVKPHGIQYHPDIILDIDYEAHTENATALMTQPSKAPGRQKSKMNGKVHSSLPTPSVSSCIPSMPSSPLMAGSGAVSESNYDFSAELAIDEVMAEREEDEDLTDLVIDEVATEKEEDEDLTDLVIDEVTAAKEEDEDFDEYDDWEMGKTQQEPKVEEGQEKRDEQKSQDTREGQLLNMEPMKDLMKEFLDRIRQPLSALDTLEKALISVTSSSDIALKEVIDTYLAKSTAAGDVTTNILDTLSYSLDRLIHPLVEREQFEDPRILDKVAVAVRRAQHIVDMRFRWIEAVCPRLFVILPERSALEEIAGSGDEQTVLAAVQKFTQGGSQVTLKWTHFRVHFLCECMGLDGIGPGHHDGPHFDFGPSAKSYQIRPGMEVEYAKRFGTYMLTLLEFLQHTTQGREIFPRIAGSLLFLAAFTFNGNTEKYKLQFEPGLRTYNAASPVDILEGLDKCLTDKDMVALEKEFLIEAQRSLGGKIAYRAAEGDIRWLCAGHARELTSGEQSLQLARLMDRPDNQDRKNSADLGILRCRVTTPAQASKVYKLIISQENIPSVWLILDWEMDLSDIEELSAALASYKVSCLQIFVHVEKQWAGAAPEFGYVFYLFVMAALRNNCFEAFSLRDIKDYSAVENVILDDLPTFRSRPFLLSNHLAKFRKSPHTDKIDLCVQAVKFDKAAEFIRKALNGFHNLSELTLEENYWEHIAIKFCADGEGVGDVVDEDYETDTALKIFEKRGHDSIKIRSSKFQTTAFLGTSRLTEVVVGFNYQKEQVLVIRNILRRNQSLKTLELMVVENLDPSLIFEQHKALLANHPALEEFHIRQDHVKTHPSEYIWNNMSVDPKTLTLQIKCYAGDMIETLLQKYAACLTQVEFYSMDAQQSATLEKVWKAKKGKDRALKLQRFEIRKVETYSQVILDDLKKIILRLPARADMRLYASLSPSTPTPTVDEPEVDRTLFNSETCLRLATFITSIASKITTLDLEGPDVRTLIIELDGLEPASTQFESLAALTLTGPFRWSTMDLFWIRKVLEASKGHLINFGLEKVDLTHQGWLTLAEMIDFSTLLQLTLKPTQPMTAEALVAFIEAVPSVGAPLLSFYVDHVLLLSKDKEIARRILHAKMTHEDAFIWINDT